MYSKGDFQLLSWVTAPRNLICLLLFGFSCFSCILCLGIDSSRADFIFIYLRPICQHYWIEYILVILLETLTKAYPIMTKIVRTKIMLRTATRIKSKYLRNEFSSICSEYIKTEIATTSKNSSMMELIMLQHDICKMFLNLQSQYFAF